MHIICSALERSSTPHKLCRMIHICFLMESAFLPFKVDRTQYSARNLIDGHPITCISTRIASLTFIMLCFETNCSCGSNCWMYRLQSAICHGECTHDSLVAGNVRNHTTRVFYLNLIQWGLNIFLAVGMEGLTQYQALSMRSPPFFSLLVDAISGEPLPERNPISPHTVYDVCTRRFLPDAQYGINYTLHCRLIVTAQKLLLRVFNLENGPKQ